MLGPGPASLPDRKLCKEGRDHADAPGKPGGAGVGVGFVNCPLVWSPDIIPDQGAAEFSTKGLTMAFSQGCLFF